MDEPAVAQVDPRMVDLCGFRLGSVCSEKKNVARLELVERDPRALGHFAAHLHRRTAADRFLELGPPRVRLQLVDAPHEAGAVEASRRLYAERRLGLLARAAPDVRVADERHRRAEDLALP